MEGISLAKEFLAEAEIELSAYRKKKRESLLRQSAEKGWAAVAQSLKALNPKIKKYSDFGETAVALAEEYKNEDIVKGEACGEALHSFGFYEGKLSPKRVEHYLLCIRDFLDIMENVVDGGRK
jgi:hypothetical protein